MCRLWKLETLAFLTVQKILYTNLLRTIICSLVNKNYCYFVILLLRYVFPFASKEFEVSLDIKLEGIFQNNSINNNNSSNNNINNNNDNNNNNNNNNNKIKSLEDF